MSCRWNVENPSSYDPTRDEGLPRLQLQLYLQHKCTNGNTNSNTGAITKCITYRYTTPSPTNHHQFCLRLLRRLEPSCLSTILLHGIGSSGDNANPTASSLSNKSPLHPTRNATAYLYDINNTLVSTASGTINYSSTSGSFTGTLYADSILAAGKYTVKVRTDTHLTRLIPGILTIAANQPTTLPDTSLVAGDVNSDNQLDILDYNLLLDCYSDLAPAVNCDATKKS